MSLHDQLDTQDDGAAGPADTPADPYLWLEEVDADAALDWVRQRNAESEAQLQGQPGYAAMQARVKTILDSKERIAFVVKRGAHFYNFWRDAEHVRGIWRRTTLAQFQLAEPAWETVIDLDRLAAEENENWVWAGATGLYPHAERCLISLSRGGGDAKVVREYDVVAGRFVTDGFVLPEAKGGMSWIDRDTVFVSTDFGPGSLTSSGYPRLVKQWRRGTALAEAALVYEGRQDDLSVSAYQDHRPGFRHQFVTRQIGFYSSELWLREGERLSKVAKPDDANAFLVRGQLIIELRSDWAPDGAITYPQGALIACDFARFMDGERRCEVLFAPTPTCSLDAVSATRDALLLNTLDKVRNRVLELRLVDGRWQRREVATPEHGSIGVGALDSIDSDQYFMTASDFVHPTTLYLCQVGSDARTALKALPGYFDAAPYETRQFEATSADGTRVPYFVVMARDGKLDGKHPTVLYGYGGFEISMKPHYSGMMGAAWLSRGGVYVLANIRGGGEFGPRWHQEALKAQRQNAFDDFIAVAEDLIARGVSSPRHLGIMGGSNGGLLVGAVMSQRPDLFNAVVCQVPLLDMRRYHRLLAGASWMGEYGNPDLAAEWAYIGRYSPYHNVWPGRRYPRVLFTTSTRDDRVHPAHARKMVAKMQEQGHDVLYWENMEGGHAGAANNDQQAQMWSLTYTFLLSQLQ
ncbi:MAG: prolyl oligopeptidase family serine peptidase [Pseudomonadota bacterium]